MSAPAQIQPCPFCGKAPTVKSRETTPSVRSKGNEYVAFVACYCGGYSATAHKAAMGPSEAEAQAAAIAAWNTRDGGLPQ